jgi:hypothetical protein
MAVPKFESKKGITIINNPICGEEMLIMRIPLKFKHDDLADAQSYVHWCHHHVFPKVEHIWGQSYDDYYAIKVSRVKRKFKKKLQKFINLIERALK